MSFVWLVRVLSSRRRGVGHGLAGAGGGGDVNGRQDAEDVAGYVPDLQDAGYVLQFREPKWHEHRFLIDHEPDVQVHVFSEGSQEVRRMLVFRDRLRTHAEDRDLYERTKRELADKRWAYGQDYADAKSSVVEAIIARAQADQQS